MENDWLNYLYSFEKQYAENNQIKIYDLIGRPDFKNIEQLKKEEEIGNEIDRLMDIMEENSIILD
ncbi:MAG: hypothetical protein R2942_16290 [Ignavibacteria bacterium]